MKFYAIIVAALLPVVACSPTTDTPVISGFNGDSVSLQGAGFLSASKPGPAFDAEANRLCARRGTKAEYASSRMVGEYTAEHLYLCI